MRVQESLLEETLYSKDHMQETVEELEETLSLCDLPLYSDQSADWDQDLSLTSNSTTTSSSHDQDYFEFFIQGGGGGGLPPENIIFCGKIITYKQLSPCKTDSSSSNNQAEIIKNQTNHKKNSRWRWKSSSRRQPVQPKNGNKSTTTFMHRRRYNTKKLGKAKWYFFLFGISRFSPVVELRDIRSRQSRRQCRSPPLSPLPVSSPPPSQMGFAFRKGDDKVSDRGWGLWALIRALSCGGNHLPTTVAADGGASPE